MLLSLTVNFPLFLASSRTMVIHTAHYTFHNVRTHDPILVTIVMYVCTTLNHVRKGFLLHSLVSSSQEHWEQNWRNWSKGKERVLPGEAASRPHGQHDLSEGTSCLDLPPQSLKHAQPACPEGPPLRGAHQGTSTPRQRCTPHSQVLTDSGRHSVLSEQDRSTQGPPVSTFAPRRLFPRGRQRGI